MNTSHAANHDAAHEVAPGVHVIPVKTFTLPPATHTNCYVIGFQELIVIDPATPLAGDQARLIAYLRGLEQRGAHIKEIWLTHHHSDHVGALQKIRETFQIPVAAHRLTSHRLPGSVGGDRSIEDNDLTIFQSPYGQAATWRALHTPGHATGTYALRGKSAHTHFWRQCPASAPSSSVPLKAT
ncbi:MAG: MBL fold metallo-hydrolase [Myxococcota bacterium]